MAVEPLAYLTNISREEMQRPMKNILFCCSCFKWLPVTIITHTANSAQLVEILTVKEQFSHCGLLKEAEEVFHKMR